MPRQYKQIHFVLRKIIYIYNSVSPMSPSPVYYHWITLQDFISPNVIGTQMGP